MSRTLRDILVVCDMDGTLLRSDNTIADCDMDTIRLFRTLGGHFTVASGRTIDSVAMYPQLASLIDPAITCGGCVIYDFAHRRVAKSAQMPLGSARRALRDILENFPAIGTLVMGDRGDATRIYRISRSQEMQDLMDDEVMTWFSRPEEDLPPKWNKVVFAAPPELLAQVAAYTEAHTYPGLQFVRTNQYYYEMMPKGANKGTALLDLCDLLELSVANTIVIGDYYNDLDMMKQAGYAVAMRNAPGEIIAAADEVTGGNDEGGVGQFLYKLIRQHEA